MNKSEFKSAYSKIVLSEEFKAQAREKLLNMAQGSTSETSSDDIPEVQAKEIVIPAKKRSVGKLIAQIGTAAAAVALLTTGGIYLYKNTDLLTPTSNQTEETSDTSNSEDDIYLADNNAIESVVGIFSFNSDCETTSIPAQEDAQAADTLNAELFSRMSFDVTAVSSGKRGGTTWTEYITESGSFILNSGSCLAEEVEYIPLADGSIISINSNIAQPFISPEDYKTQNYLSPQYFNLSLCEKRIDGKAYYSAQWTLADESCYLNAQGLSEEEVADIIAKLVYGENTIPQSFGIGTADTKTVAASYGTLNVTALVNRPQELTTYTGDIVGDQDDGFFDYFDEFGFDMFEYNIPFTGDRPYMEYCKESDSTEMFTDVFEGSVELSKSVKVTILRGDYRESRREYCAAERAPTKSFRDTGIDVIVSSDADITALTAGTVATYQAEWQDENGDYYTLVATDISLDDMSYILAQLVEKNNLVVPAASDTVETAYGTVNVYGFSLGYDYAIPLVYNENIAMKEVTKFVGSDILSEIVIPFNTTERSIVYDAFFWDTGLSKVDFDSLDSLSASYYDSARGVFTSDDCPLFNGQRGVREVVASYIGDGEKGVTINVSTSIGTSMLSGAGLTEYNIANNSFECSNDCSMIFIGEDNNESGAYYAVFYNDTIDKYIRVNSSGISVKEFVDIVYALCNVQEITTADYDIDSSGNVEYSITTFYSDINFGATLDGQKLEQVLNFPAFSGSAEEAINTAIETTGFAGLEHIGDDNFDVRAAYGLSLDAGTSLVLTEDGTLISLHYISDSGEMFINFSDEEHLYDIRRVTDSDGKSWIIDGGDSGACFIPTEQQRNGLDFLSGEDPTNNTWLGGKEVDGTLYYEGFRRTSGIPSEALFITVSAKGMQPKEFANVMSVLVQSMELYEYNEINTTPVEEAETANGTLLINGGGNYGTGGGYMHDVSSSKNYNYNDLQEFCGMDLSVLEIPFETKYSALTYSANYAEFHSGENLGLYRTGQPLEGEENDDVFKAAQEYFINYEYTYDKLEYFADKTPTVKEYNLNYYNAEDFMLSTKWLTIKLIEGDFSERYLGTGFEKLNPTPSEGFCEDYLNAHREEFEQGMLSRVYVCSYNGDGIDRLYGGFMKDGIYYVVESSGITTEEYADILAQLYTG